MHKNVKFNLKRTMKFRIHPKIGEAVVPEKETKILKEGARGDRGSPDQNESPIPDLSNAL